MSEPTNEEPAAAWRPIETAKLLQRGVFWHPLWKQPVVGVRDDDEAGLVGWVYVEMTDQRFLASHWMLLPSPPGEAAGPTDRPT